jgi:hypothetical protein
MAEQVLLRHSLVRQTTIDIHIVKDVATPTKVAVKASSNLLAEQEAALKALEPCIMPAYLSL